MHQLIFDGEDCGWPFIQDKIVPYAGKDWARHLLKTSTVTGNVSIFSLDLARVRDDTVPSDMKGVLRVTIQNGWIYLDDGVIQTVGDPRVCVELHDIP